MTPKTSKRATALSARFSTPCRKKRQKSRHSRRRSQSGLRCLGRFLSAGSPPPSFNSQILITSLAIDILQVIPSSSILS